MSIYDDEDWLRETREDLLKAIQKGDTERTLVLIGGFAAMATVAYLSDLSDSQSYVFFLPCALSLLCLFGISEVKTLLLKSELREVIRRLDAISDQERY